jgi:hypothetical protein
MKYRNRSGKTGYWVEKFSCIEECKKTSDYPNMTGNVRINITLRRVLATNVAVEKQ